MHHALSCPDALETMTNYILIYVSNAQQKKCTDLLCYDRPRLIFTTLIYKYIQEQFA